MGTRIPALMIFIFSIYCSEGLKILLVFPLPVRSLNLLGEAFVKHLLNAGHEVTYITAYPLKNKSNKNFQQIDVGDNVQVFLDDNLLNMTRVLEYGYSSEQGEIYYYQDVSIRIAMKTFENENVLNLLKDTTQMFDAVIVDLFETELYSGLSALYSCPMIWSYSLGPNWIVQQMIDEASNPAYTAHYGSYNVPPFTFVQRLEELWTQIHWTFLKWYTTAPQEKATYEKIFGPLLHHRGKTLPPYENLIYNTSLILSLENNPGVNIQSTPQNFKFIGGYHIEIPPKPLPKDLQNLMDNAEHGVIYFSMGTTFKSKDFPESMKNGLLKQFQKLKQTVIWKFEEDLPNVPKNVHIIRWAPQHSILAHPKCLFFISHGGLLSSIEAIHFGVPIIGVPVFLDQFLNVNRAIARGFAIGVNLAYDLPDQLKSAIETMLNDNKYRKKVKELSLIYHDRPVSPGRELVHWVEHVVKTGGAPHLRSPALDVPLYQKLYLDLAAVVLVVLFVLIYAIKRLFSITLKNDTKKKRKLWTLKKKYL